MPILSRFGVEIKKMGTKGPNIVPLFTICCQQGRVKLPEEPQPPPLLKKLETESPHYQQNIRTYNSILAFTSMRAQIDQSVMHKNGPFTFRIHGQNHHRISSLLSDEGKIP